MCERTFITEIQDLQRKIPITVKRITCEQAVWLKNGKKLQIESKKSGFYNNNNNNNNTLFSVLHQQSDDQLQIQHK
jgi:hypothetical protein